MTGSPFFFTEGIRGFTNVCFASETDWIVHCRRPQWKCQAFRMSNVSIRQMNLELRMFDCDPFSLLCLRPMEESSWKRSTKEKKRNVYICILMRAAIKESKVNVVEGSPKVDPLRTSNFTASHLSPTAHEPSRWLRGRKRNQIAHFAALEVKHKLFLRPPLELYDFFNSKKCNEVSLQPLIRSIGNNSSL